ncbi:MAG: alpha/beta hydrolase [Ilumatobacteraceae bacterium]
MSGRRNLAPLLLAALIAGACAPAADVTTRRSDRVTTNGVPNPTTSSPGSPSTVDGEPPIWEASIEWSPFAADTGVESGTLEVPIDYEDPSAGTFQLFVARHLADPDRRIGSLLVNPGGPGFGGSDFAIFAAQVFSPTLLERFDIVGWDPRGTGRSEPAVDCIDDWDAYTDSVDITPDTPDERALLVDLAEQFADACVERNGELLDHIGTNSSARDIDTLRRALGEATISYFGFSYGSELGAVWSTMFPDTVRAAVLDGAVDPSADFFEGTRQQITGFERSLNSFLDACSRDRECAFSSDGNAQAAFDDLMAALDESPIPSVDGRPDVTRGIALAAVALGLYDEAYWKRLARALDNARYGEGAELLAMYDLYYQRNSDGSYGNQLEAFQAIVCADTRERPDVEDEDAFAAELRSIAPRFAPSTAGTYFCTFFPPSTDPRTRITGGPRVPMIVIGTTGDPATPLAGTERMAAALRDGRLVIVDADTHTGYGENECIIDLVDRYLLDPAAAPTSGTRCD